MSVTAFGSVAYNGADVSTAEAAPDAVAAVVPPPAEHPVRTRARGTIRRRAVVEAERVRDAMSELQLSVVVQAIVLRLGRVHFHLMTIGFHF